jgi:hypothetical protein
LFDLDFPTPLYVKGGWGDFTTGLENPPLTPLFKDELYTHLTQRPYKGLI